MKNILYVFAYDTQYPLLRRWKLYQLISNCDNKTFNQIYA